MFDPQQNDQKLDTLFTYIGSGDFKKTKEFLTANKELLNQKDDQGFTALTKAARLNLNPNANNLREQLNAKNNIVSWLVEQGADVTPRDNTGHNALHYATQNNFFEVARILTTKNKDLVNSSAKNNWQPLHFAAYHNCPEIAQLLIALDASIHSQAIVNSDGEKMTPLEIAENEDHEEMIATLNSQTSSSIQATTSQQLTQHQRATHL